jgi:Protein of unknown function (DUF1759)
VYLLFLLNKNKNQSSSVVAYWNGDSGYPGSNPGGAKNFFPKLPISFRYSFASHFPIICRYRFDEFLASDRYRSDVGAVLGYAQAIQILREEYGNTKIIIEARLMQLYKLHDGPKHRDIQGLKQLYTELNMHIRELTALGHPIDSLGSFIVTLLLQRMPTDMQQIWWQGEERGPKDHKEIMEFVQKQITIRQRVSRTQEKKEGESSNPGKARAPNNVAEPTAAALAAGAERIQGMPMRACLFCNETTHKSGKCPMKIEDRKAFLKKNGRCFICIWPTAAPPQISL